MDPVENHIEPAKPTKLENNPNLLPKDQICQLIPFL